jgi:methylmalonyl-CoA mutase
MTGVNEFPLLGDDGTEPVTADRDALLAADRRRAAERPEITGLDDLQPGALAAAPGERLKRATALATAGARLDEISAALGDSASGLNATSATETGSGPGTTSATDTGSGIAPLEPRPDAAPFERLRAATDAHEAAGGERPRIYLACLGAIAAHVNFANWAKSFFEVSGIETVPSGALEGNEAQASTFSDGGFSVAAVCAGRKEDPAEVADLVSKLRGAGAEYVYMVNSTPEINEASGADEVVRNGVDMESVLIAALDRLGVNVPAAAAAGASGAAGSEGRDA